jgi:hypothetical protein
MATTGSNPFQPVKFTPGPPTPQTGIWEDGPGFYVNPVNTGTPVKYSGQDQTAAIVNAQPKPPRHTYPAAAGTDSKIK